MLKMSKKRQHKTLSLDQKLSILHDLKSGKSGKLLAETYGVGRSTIVDIKKNKEKLEKFAAHSSNAILSKRKTLKSGEFEEFEKKLYEWFESQRNKNICVSNDVLRTKAKDLFEKIYGNEQNFSASAGWCQKFKKRFAIRPLKICGESLSSRPDLATTFQNELQALVTENDFLDCQIYNADESGLFWKMFPDKTLVHEREKTAPGRKMSKERITFLVCANKSGQHKLRIAVVGKSKNPRSFKNIIPMDYYSAKNSWMTFDIFSLWFYKSFIPQVKQYQLENNLPRKAVLIVDNASCHTKQSLESECKQYKIIFLPPNCTSILQPMDQNPIRLTKLFYKKSLLHELISSDLETDVFLKTFSLKSAYDILLQSWDKISVNVLKSSWLKLFPKKWTSEDDIPLAELRQQEMNSHCNEIQQINLISEMLNNSTSENCITENEVNDWINEISMTDHNSDIESEYQTDEDHHIEPKITRNEAINALNIVLTWAQQNNYSTQFILQLREHRNIAQEAALKASHQTNIHEFFKTL